VNDIYGSASGLTSVGNQNWAKDSPDITGVADAGDQFGAALATEGGTGVRGAGA
jgi:hypothetical protein